MSYDFGIGPYLWVICSKDLGVLKYLIGIFIVVAVAGYFVWQAYQLPPGVEPMGDGDEMIARIGLYSSIAGACAAFLGVIKEIFSFLNRKKVE